MREYRRSGKMTTAEVMNMILPLVGVVIGGLITYFVQTKAIRETHKFEREKIEEENIKKDKELKYQAYNQILLNDAIESINIYDFHHGWELDYNKYAENIRPVLFKVFHLLDGKVADELLKIENTYAKIEALGEPEEGDKENLSESYNKIKEIIRHTYKDEFNKKNK